MTKRQGKACNKMFHSILAKKDDDFPQIPDTPNENFSVMFYEKAQNYIEDHWREMTVHQANEFSRISLYMENEIHQRMAKLAENSNLSFEEMTEIIQEKVDDGRISSAEVSKFSRLILVSAILQTFNFLTLFHYAKNQNAQFACGLDFKNLVF